MLRVGLWGLSGAIIYDLALPKKIAGESEVKEIKIYMQRSEDRSVIRMLRHVWWSGVGSCYWLNQNEPSNFGEKERVKVLEVLFGRGSRISGDMHSRTNKVKIKIHQYFSLTVNIVTKKSKFSSAFDYTAMPHGRDSDEDMEDRRISKSQMNPQRPRIFLLKKRLKPNFPLWMKIATTRGNLPW